MTTKEWWSLVNRIGAKPIRAVPIKGTQIKTPTSGEIPPRSLTAEKLTKLITHYQSDPLTWNPSVLGRIFNIPDYYCKNLATYVQPMVYLNKATGEGNIRLINTTFVVDVARLKSDENYLATYRRIIFPKVTKST